MKIEDLWNADPILPAQWAEDADGICAYLAGHLDLQQRIDHPPLQDVEIETLNRCNNDCSFCPVSRLHDIRPYKRMELPLFEKIIGDLADMEYHGTLSLYSNNEPLLDNRLFDMLAYAKEKLPGATHVLYTNGILLTANALAYLEKVLDRLVIDIYTETPYLPENFSWLRAWQGAQNCKIQAVLRNKHQVLTTRGGNAPNKKSQRELHSVCLYPFRQMVIRPDGKVSKCCHDTYGRTVLGDLNTESVRQVWEGTAFCDFRREMLQDRPADRGCGYCDVLLYDCSLSEAERTAMCRSLLLLLRQKHQQGRRICLCGSTLHRGRLEQLLGREAIPFEVLTEHNARQLLRRPDVYLVAEHYTNRALQIFKAAGKKHLKDFILSFRCV